MPVFRTQLQEVNERHLYVTDCWRASDYRHFHFGPNGRPPHLAQRGAHLFRLSSTEILPLPSFRINRTLRSFQLRWNAPGASREHSILAARRKLKDLEGKPLPRDVKGKSNLNFCLRFLRWKSFGYHICIQPRNVKVCDWTLQCDEFYIPAKNLYIGTTFIRPENIQRKRKIVFSR